MRANLKQLQAGLLRACGVQPDARFLQTQAAESKLGWIAGASRSLCNPQNFAPDADKQALDTADRFRGWTLVDFARATVSLSEGEATARGLNSWELAERALTIGAGQELFTTAIGALVLRGYSKPDSTEGWVKAIDIGNFREVPLIEVQTGRLSKQARNAAPEPVEAVANSEQFQAATYSGRAELTREDILDAEALQFLTSTPSALGQAAAEVRPDAVYSLLLSNPNLSDGNALFGGDSAIDNRTAATGVLASGSLETATTKFHTITGSGGRILSDRVTHWVVPESRLLHCNRLIKASSIDETSPFVRVVPDARLDVGSYDYDSGQVVAADGTKSYLSGQATTHGIVVGYVADTDRSPTIEQYKLRDGVIGIGISVGIEIGVAAASRVGIASIEE